MPSNPPLITEEELLSLLGEPPMADAAPPSSAHRAGDPVRVGAGVLWLAKGLTLLWLLQNATPLGVIGRHVWLRGVLEAACLLVLIVALRRSWAGITSAALAAAGTTWLLDLANLVSL